MILLSFSPAFDFVGDYLNHILIILFLSLFLFLQCLALHMPGTWQICIVYSVLINFYLSFQLPSLLRSQTRTGEDSTVVTQASWMFSCCEVTHGAPGGTSFNSKHILGSTEFAKHINVPCSVLKKKLMDLSCVVFQEELNV